MRGAGAMRYGKWAMMAVTLLVIGAAAYQGDMIAYIKHVKTDHTAGEAYLNVMTAPQELDSLYEQISREAAKRRVAPVDAVVDRIWKAIPGYNGLEVDIEETYRRAQAARGLPIEYVVHEIEPEVKLSDLGAYPIYKGNPNKPMVSLMINVAWGNEYIKPMLQTLREHKVKATFFLDGSWLNNNSELAELIQKEGHELSNHAYSHPDMSRLGRQEASLQISRTEALLKEKLKVENRWFAPPSGDFNQQTVEIAAQQGLRTVLWTLDTIDWRKPSSSSLVQKVRLRVEPGTLILMHPTASSSGALAGMIQEIRAKGLELGTVSETLSEKRVAPVEPMS